MRTMLLVVVLAAPAWAQRPELSASLGFASETLGSSQYDLVAKDDALPMYRVGAGVGFKLPVGSLDAELTWRSGSSGATAHQSVSSELRVRGLEVGAAYRYPWLKHLQPYVRLGAGWDWASLSLLDVGCLTQTVSHPSGSLLAGVQVPFRLGSGAAWAPEVSIDLGLGGVLRPAYAFGAMAPTPPSGRVEDPIARGTVNLGAMPMSGFTWRLGLTVRL